MPEADWQAWVEILPDFSKFGRRADDEIGNTLGTAGARGGERYASGFTSGVFKGNFLNDLAFRAIDATTAAIERGIDYAFDGVNLAGSLGEQVNAVQVQFGELSDEILDLANKAPRNLNLTRAAFDQIAVRFSNSAQTIAQRGGTAADVIRDLTQRGADFASVYDLEVNDSLALFQSGLAGETEPLRRFGIDLSANAVEAYAYANGIAAVGAELTDAEKVQARYGLLLEQTAKVEGDLANTRGSLANQQRELNVQLEEAQTRFGEALLPSALDVTTFANQELLPILEDALDDAGPAIAASLKDALPEIKAVLESAAEILPSAITAGGNIGQALADSFQADSDDIQYALDLVNGRAEVQGYDWAKLFADAAADGLLSDSPSVQKLNDAVNMLLEPVEARREAAAEQAAKLADSYAAGFATADGWEHALDPVEKIGLGVAEQGERAMEELRAALASGSPRVLAEALGLKLGIDGELKQIPNLGRTTGVDLVAGLVQGINDNLWQVAKAGLAVADTALASVKVGLDSHSPSRKMYAEGENAIDGFNLGWENGVAPLTIPSLSVPDVSAGARAALGAAAGSDSGLFGRELVLVVDGRPMRAYIAEGAAAVYASAESAADAERRLVLSNGKKV